MSENIQRCLLCEGIHRRVFARTNFRDYQVVYQICDRCGFVYQSPRFSEAELDDFYAAGYRQLYQGEEAPTLKDLRIQELRANVLVHLAKQYVSGVKRHLDIGCSAGKLLNAFQNQFDSTPVGIEPGHTYRDYTQASGITVYPDISEAKTFEKEPFDFISMAHVLEHFPDPVKILIQLREQFLEPAGSLLVEVPNLYAHDSFEIAHLSAFSAHTLREALKRAGYKVIVLKKHGQPRSRLLPLYLTALAQPGVGVQSSPVVPERFVRQKRRFGMLKRRIIQKIMPDKAWIRI